MNEEKLAEVKAKVFAFTADLSEKTGVDLDPEEIWADCLTRMWADCLTRMVDAE